MYNTATLPNGLRLVHCQNNSLITHAGVYVAVGSRHEVGREEGMAHFIEHSIFKGTIHRKAFHILNRIDGVGGELNAFTTKEETCIYSSALSLYLDRSLDLLSDILFNSTFPSKEIDNEKEVVIEEIDSYRDSPSDLIYDEFEERFFKGGPLAHNILGTKKNVRAFKSSQLSQFMHSNYTPNRMVVSVVGPNSFAQVRRLVEKYFLLTPSLTSTLTPIQLISPLSPYTPTTSITNKFNITLSRHTHQSHVMMGCVAPDSYSDDKVAFSLLNNILGGPAMNSRLNVAIREHYGFCYTIESQYTPFTDIGLFTIYAGIDSGALERYIELVNRELLMVCDTLMTTSKLAAVKRQYVGQMALNNESSLNEMQSIGKAMLTYGRVDTLEEMRRDIEAVTSEQLRDVARKFLTMDKLSTLVYK